jgi:MFS family permease
VILITNYTGSLFLAAWIYLNLFFRDVGISYFELGVANSWAMLIGLFATMFGGYYADKYIQHRKYLAAFNKFFVAIATFGITMVTDFSGVIFVWTVFGFSQFCQSSLGPIVFESLPPEHLGTAMSLFTLGGVFGIGGLVIVGVLIENGFVAGLKVFFSLSAAGSFLDFIIRILFLEKKQLIQDSESNEKQKFIKDLFGQYRTGIKVLIATIPLFVIVYILDATSDINYRFAESFYLNEEVGMVYSAINLTMIGATIVGVLGGLVAGFLLDKSEKEAKVMFLVYFLLPFSVLLLLLSPYVPKWINLQADDGIISVVSSTAFIAIIIKAGNDQVWRMVSIGAVGRKLPREHTGKATAILAMIVSLLGVIISPIAGFVYEMEGGIPLLMLVLAINLLILLLLLVGWLRSPRKEKIQTSVISATSV